MGKSKRVGALALAASLAVFAAACGSDDDDGGAAATTTAAASSSSAAPTTSAGTATTAGPTTTAGTATTGGSATTTPSGECKAGTPVVTPVETLKADGAGKTVGLLFDVTGRGDKSFNDGAAAGLDKAKADFKVSGVESTPTATDGSDRPDRINQMSTGPAQLIIGVGFLWGSGVTQAAKDYPEKHFALIDEKAKDDNGTPDNPSDDKPLPNVRNITFAEEQGSFLVGVAAACASKSGKIGFIGGVETDLIKKFEAGFKAGVKYVDPKATVQVNYLTQIPDFTGFNDPAKGKSAAAAMYSSGIDVIYHAAGGSGKGLFEAAVEAGKPGEVWAIGVDSDQYNSVDATQQPYILTSMLKRVDLGTYQAIADELNGSFKAEDRVYDLKANGVGYSASNKAINDYAGTIEAAKADIISGKIVVPDKP
jgi:basic membrane protein A